MEMHCCKIHLGQHPMFLMCLMLVMLLAIGRGAKIKPTDEFTDVLCQVLVIHMSDKLFGCCYRNSPPCCIANSSYCAGLSCLEMNESSVE